MASKKHDISELLENKETAFSRSQSWSSLQEDNVHG